MDFQNFNGFEFATLNNDDNNISRQANLDKKCYHTIGLHWIALMYTFAELILGIV